MKKILLLLALATSLSAQAQQRIYVRAAATGTNNGQSWTDAYADLQAAIQASQPGDTLWIAEGLYRPTAGTDRNISFEPKSGTALYGGFAGTEAQAQQRDWAAHPTVLSGDIGTPGDSTDNSRCVVYLFEPDSSTVLDGLTLRDGVADATTGAILSRGRSGAGLYVMGQDAEAYPNILNCRFEHNTARNAGGGAMVNGSGDGSVGPLFRHCEFVNNRASNGGGMARQGASWVERGTEWDSCAFVGNHATLRGGGLYYADTEGQDSIQVQGCRFAGNFAGTAGGGGFFFLGRNNGEVRFSVRHCTVQKNISKEGIAFDFFTNFAFFEGLVEISNCLLEENRPEVQSNSSLIYMDFIANTPNTSILILKNLFRKNTFLSRMSALSCVSGKLSNTQNIYKENESATCLADTDFGEISVSNCLFLGNLSNALSLGGPLTALFFRNCVFKNNKPISTSLKYFSITYNSILRVEQCNFIENGTYVFCTSNDSGTIYLSNSVLFLESSFFVSHTIKSYIYNSYFEHPICPSQFAWITCGPGLLTGLDPLFVAPDSGDYRLQPCSPLVNAGSNAYVSASNTHDLGGQPRIQGGTVDIGAYETAPPALTAAPTVVPACKGQPNGSLSLSAAGGCAPLTYAWASASGQTGSSTGGLAPGQYTFTVSDQRGSSFTLSVSVPDGGGISLSAAASPLLCADTLGGSVRASAQGGVPPLGFSWAGSAIADSLRTGLAPGLYAVTVSDERGCTATATAEVKKEGILGSSVEFGPVSCFGAADGSITVLPTSGKPPYDWAWQGSPVKGPTLAPLGPGEYRLTLTDAWGCEAVWGLPLSQPDSLLVSGAVISPASDSAAADGSVSVTAAGGTLPYTGLWSNGQPGLSATGLLPGIYMLTLTDARGCSFTVSYAVGVTSGVDEPGTVPLFSAQPNPTDGGLDVLLARPAAAGAAWSLSDASARVLRQGHLPEGVLRLSLNLGALPSGVYWLRLLDARGAGTARVVKR